MDDNRDSANSLAMLLRLLGHTVDTAHDGLEAVEKAMTFRADVILLDIGMPRLNGYEAARRIREQHAEGFEIGGSDRLGPGGRPPPLWRSWLRCTPGQAG